MRGYDVQPPHELIPGMDYIIIVAGGKGLRMGGDIPKQFMTVGGKPILMRTIDCFHQYSDDIRIILVLPEAHRKYWQELCAEYHFDTPHEIVQGGETRFHSVSNGLAAIPNDATGVVGVHDGVRPFVDCDMIKRLYDAAHEKGAAIPVTPVIETLRSVVSGKNVMRSDYVLVQTPQVFDIQLLKRAYRQTYREQFTDDASVVESIGVTVTLVEGRRENIKVTTPFDMVIAEALVNYFVFLAVSIIVSIPFV